MGEDRQRYENVFPRDGWPAGPWDREPLDKAVWIDDETGYDCMIVRGPLGAWCGYIGLPKGHPAYKVNAFEILGGEFNYGEMCDDESPEEASICHVPAPGRDGEVYWVGFDLAHAWDIAPAMFVRHSFMRDQWDALSMDQRDAGVMEDGWAPVTYKNEAYARERVVEAAKSLAAM